MKNKEPKVRTSQEANRHRQLKPTPFQVSWTHEEKAKFEEIKYQLEINSNSSLFRLWIEREYKKLK